MKTKLFIPLALLGTFFLTGCSQMGPLPNFGKAITPQWITADFDGQAGDEYIATSNLQDIIFNSRGEVIGWYVKNYAGTPFIKQRRDGSYDFSGLKTSSAILNMVKHGPSMAVSSETLQPGQDVEASKPELATNLEKNEHTATFKYTQNGVTVTKKMSLSTKGYLIDLNTQVEGGPEKVEMSFYGLGSNHKPSIKALKQGSTEPASVSGDGTVKVENVQYAALQDGQSQINHAIIIRPQKDTKIDASLQGGEKSLIKATLPISSDLQIYGGRNELIHLYQSGYNELPGLFSANTFGQISLWLVKLMEMLYSSIKDWGLVIVALTILLRLAQWPLMQAQGRTTARMQYVQPKIKEIQEKYAGQKDLESQRAMQTEVQALYRDNQINPLGCLSMFLPMPILFAMWMTIRNFEFGTGFLWLPDLATPDPWYILALVYMAVNFAQLYVSTRKTPEMFKQQAMIYVVFIYFALIFPAGVTIYIIISTAIGIFQQVLINKQVEMEIANMGDGQTVEKSDAKPSHKNTSAQEKKPKKKDVKTLDAPKKSKDDSK